MEEVIGNLIYLLPFYNSQTLVIASFFGSFSYIYITYWHFSSCVDLRLGFLLCSLLIAQFFWWLKVKLLIHNFICKWIYSELKPNCIWILSINHGHHKLGLQPWSYLICYTRFLGLSFMEWLSHNFKPKVLFSVLRFSWIYV